MKQRNLGCFLDFWMHIRVMSVTTTKALATGAQTGYPRHTETEGTLGYAIEFSIK